MSNGMVVRNSIELSLMVVRSTLAVTCAISLVAVGPRDSRIIFAQMNGASDLSLNVSDLRLTAICGVHLLVGIFDRFQQVLSNPG